MIRIWFKKRYVVEIVSGLKRETTRRYSRRMANLKPGQAVAFSVGAVEPFATAKIQGVSRLFWDDMSAAKQAELANLGIAGDDGEGFLRIEFENVEAINPECMICGARRGRCKEPDKCDATASQAERRHQ